MASYQGQIVHSARDPWGVIDVVDNASERSLHFGNLPRQSAMLRADPYHLLLDYTRAMTAGLLFSAPPRRVLLIGLGGGSLAKFFFRHFPACRIDAVELRPAVIGLAHGYFHLPFDARLRVHAAEGAGYVGECAQPGYDLILVDAYDAETMAASTRGEPFADGCRRLLGPQGVLVHNLWRRDRTAYRHTLEGLRRCFEAPPLRLPARGKGNVIVLARNDAATSLRALRPRAETLQHTLGLDYGGFLAALKPDRPPLAQRWRRWMSGRTDAASAPID